MLQNKLKPQNAHKLSKAALKTITGGVGNGQDCPPSCWFDIDNTACPEGQYCAPFYCGKIQIQLCTPIPQD